MTFAVENSVAVLTAPGRSALATLGLAGPNAWEIVRRLFRSHKGASLPEKPEAGRFWLGRLGGDLADEVVLVVRATLPVLRLEIHGHGGREIVGYLVELLGTAGAREIGWQDWLSGEEESAETIAERLLPRALTTRTASILLDQMQGAFGREMQTALGSLQQGDVSLARLRLTALRERGALGLHLTEPFRVVIAGAPNVGKSSLANAFAGYQRSIVSPTPGTTRDLVTTPLAVDGWPVTLTDTAGLRLGGQALESLGIEQARLAIAAADVCLWVVDASAGPVWPDVSDAKMHIVVNKIDLPPAWDVEGVEAIRVSATTGRGMEELCAAMSRWLVPGEPPAGSGVPISAGQVGEISKIIASLDAG